MRDSRRLRLWGCPRLRAAGGYGQPVDAGIDAQRVAAMMLILNLNKRPTDMAENTPQIPIQLLEKGSKGRVTALIGEADEVARLSALGIRKGVEVCAVRKGCPCIVQYGCSRMCLRTAGNLRVMVSPV
jgi:Fe2+ transport system protein FeoA